MKRKKLFIALAVAVCLLIVFYCLLTWLGSRDIVIDETRAYQVSQVIDGDTFMVKIDRQAIIVRMLGIDTPETVDPRKPEQCFGREASDKTKSLLTGRLVYLKANPNREKKDRYGRYLLYVYTGDLFVNEYLIREGFAREYTYGKPYSFQARFRSVEREAQQAGRGLWLVCDGLI